MWRTTRNAAKIHTSACRHVRCCKEKVEAFSWESGVVGKCCGQPCLVCMTEVGRPVRSCLNDHSFCDLCMEDWVQFPSIELTCPCGCGASLNPQADLTENCFKTWISKIPVQTDSSPRTFPSMDGVVHDLVDEACRTACPWCDTRFSGYDGCAAVICDTCNRHFCGMCFKRCDSSASAHAHALRCPKNTTTPLTYFIPEDQVASINLCRTEVNFETMMDRVRRKDGTLFFLALARQLLARKAIRRRSALNTLIGKRATDLLMKPSTARVAKAMRDTVVSIGIGLAIAHVYTSESVHSSIDHMYHHSYV